ncbi:MAG: uroporphyrinogen-III C-methyltransferase [Planctomycetes bacterium]|nr:uroporphyrinogen-III C-methyltransferase [Planctomycetota bacterium]
MSQPSHPSKSPAQNRGIVYLVGAGPGDPGLLTVRAAELIRTADVIVFDALANPVLLAQARPDVEFIDAGKRAKSHKLTQDETNALLAAKALAGKTVVRLKGGDPYVFGRGSEEAMYLYERGVRVEMVPGITAAMAGPAYAGIPVTHRQVATTVTFITGHEDPTKPETQIDYDGLAKLAQTGGTLCFYMGMGRLGIIVDALTSRGVSPQTPAGVVQWGTHPHQRSLRTTLDQLAAEVEAAGLGAPAIIIIGPVVAVDPDGALRWFEQRPLFGKTVLITRTRHQASELRMKLEALGAGVLEAPTIEIVPPADWSPIDSVIRHLNDYDWLILTSVNGVAALRERLDHLTLDARHLAGVKIAVIGDATAAAMRAMGLRPDLVPTQFVAESLAADLIAQGPVAGERILMLRADIARPVLAQKLADAGASVDDVSIYETKTSAALPDEVIEALREKKVDYVTFTSSSTASNFVELLGKDREILEFVKIASIGPITSQTARNLGLDVHIEATTYNIDGLIAAIVAAAT